MATLAEMLVDQGVVDGDSLSQAESYAAESGVNLAQSLVALGLATEAQLVRAFAASVGLAYTDVTPEAVDRTAVALLDPEVARELTVLPVGYGPGDEVVVAFADPAAHDELREELGRAIGLPISLALAPRRALVEAIAVQTELAVGGNGSAVAAPAATATSQPPPPSRPEPTERRPVVQPDRPDRRQTASGGVGGRVMSEEEPTVDLDELLNELVDRGGSDLHLTAGIPPAIRINGQITSLDHYEKLVPDELQRLLYAIMTQKQREAFENELELDISYSIRDIARFRVNIFQQRNSMGAVMRVIPYEILPLEELGIPDQVAEFAYLPRGFVLVTGPTGSGKSTTLASLIDLANRNRSAHIMTVEDPIEFLHKHKNCVVNQREVGTDTRGFAAA
ncbi:MAG: ATPase, T2SS/T4P/T4SS family, partial [Nitriliruptoraceae bacterium]